MMLPASSHSLVALALERLLFCAIAGTALVVMVSAALKLLPACNSQTRFAVWFSAMLAVAALPFSAFIPSGWLAAKISSPAHTVFTISISWAEYVFVAWGVMASAGLLRVAVGLGKLRRLRQDSLELTPRDLDPEIFSLITGRGGRRRVSLLVSSAVEVPTAIGFFRPAIILPAWLIAEHRSQGQERPAQENLKYVLLHELAHLRRCDDWTNLAQQLVRALLFFHPGILWIERKLALDREMACDDAVVAETESPRHYAECLAYVAEKSFLRRQLALAQAAVSRVKQLSRRVMRILDSRRSSTTRVWKPAIPMVAGAAILCAVCAPNTTELVGFSDAHNPGSSMAAAPPVGGQVVGNRGMRVGSGGPTVTPTSLSNTTPVQALPADLRYQSEKISRPRSAHRSAGTIQRRDLTHRAAVTPVKQRSRDQGNLAQLVLSNDSQSQPAVARQPQSSEVVLVMVSSRRFISNGDDHGWQISTVEFYFYVPAHHKQVPNKT
ncbi:MAG TPA: M56 family metallopeptidase [Candidatus Angelobacter sp.]|nr:M56 family metallopeptidase [Candidatus Angelobacter sp.]